MLLMRLRYCGGGRRLQNCLKLTVCVLVAAFYFTFLFRESLNAIEQNKEKAAAAAALLGNGNGLEYSISISSSSNTNNNNGKQQEKTKPPITRAPLDRRRGPVNHRAPPPKTIVGLRHEHMLLWQQQQRINEQEERLHEPTTINTGNRGTGTESEALSTLNPVYEYSEELHSATENDLQRRRQHLLDVCRRHNLQTSYPPNPWEFFISPGHNLVWCNVFKAASSTWMYYFNILGGYDIKYLQRTESQPLELARQRFPRPELPELLESLPSALSFLFVRDPFERIVSAYRNKLEGGRNPYYKALGHKIVHKFRRYPLPASVLNSPGGGRHKSGPTFTEFLRYLIHQHAEGKQFDEHWAPVYSFCTPCSVNFTIIGKLETFQRDSEFIIRQAGLESLLLGKLPRNKMRKIGNLASGVKSNELVEKYFSSIDRETLDQLLNIYRLDFELFDYNYTKYYDYVKPSATNETIDNHGAVVNGTHVVATSQQRQRHKEQHETISVLPSTTVP